MSNVEDAGARYAAHTFEYIVDIENKKPGFECSDRKPPLPILLKFVDVVCKVTLQSQTDWNLKRPLKFNRQPAWEKEILHGITGVVMPGEVLAMMGPSGSGKTTLLNLLGGRARHSLSGSITYNDLNYHKSLKRRMGFVTQDDVLFQNLTVRETLTYAAILRLPNSLTRAQKIQRAEDIILDLGLERCRDTIIGGPFMQGVSGGERKRVCIGHEILVDPSLLFLDEPTSGLDSTTALRIIQVIKNIAEAGRTVVTTIHQPSSTLFYMFDKLLLLSEGYALYFGKATSSVDYFTSIGLSPLRAMNPADFLLDLASGNISDVSVPPSLESKVQLPSSAVKASPVRPTPQDVRKYLVESFKQQLEPKERTKLFDLDATTEELKTAIAEKREWSTTWWQQFELLMIRGFKERKGEYFSWLRFVEVATISFIVGCLWFKSKRGTASQVEDQLGLFFFMVVFWGLFPLFTAIFTFPLERAMLSKERASDMYRLSAYFLARTLGDLPLDLIMPVLFIIIVYFMTNLYMNAGIFFLTMLTLCLDVVTAQGLGFFIGAAVMDVKKGSTVASIVSLAFMLTGGFFIQHTPVWMRWLKYISFNYYSYKLFMKVQFRASETYDCSSPTGCKSLGTLPNFHGVSLGGGGEEAWVLLIMVVGYRVLAYIALRRMKIGG